MREALFADVMELADLAVSETVVFGRAGSTPAVGTRCDEGRNATYFLMLTYHREIWGFADGRHITNLVSDCTETTGFQPAFRYYSGRVRDYLI